MEEFGDWIYILVIVIAGVSSMISSMRKKARQDAEANKPREIINDNNSEDNFWDVLTPQPEKKPVIKSYKRRDMPLSSITFGKQKKSFLDNYLEGQSAIDIEAPDESETLNAVEDYASITVEDIPRDAGEWRKVFIYNEIFSRKN